MTLLLEMLFSLKIRKANYRRNAMKRKNNKHEKSGATNLHLFSNLFLFGVALSLWAVKNDEEEIFPLNLLLLKPQGRFCRQDICSSELNTNKCFFIIL